GDVSGPEFLAAAQKDDADLSRLVAQLDLDRDTLIITADHGHRDAGGHGGDEPECISVPLVAVGAGVSPGQFGPARLVDVAPTIAALLGLPFPAASQGQPLVDMLELEPPTQAALLERAAQQRERVAVLLAATFARAASRDVTLRVLRFGALGLAMTIL